MVGRLGVGRSTSSDIVVTSSFDASSVVRSGIVLGALPVVGPAYMFDGSSLSFKLAFAHGTNTRGKEGVATYFPFAGVMIRRLLRTSDCLASQAG